MKSLAPTKTLRAARLSGRDLGARHFRPAWRLVPRLWKAAARGPKPRGQFWTDAELLSLDTDDKRHELWFGKVVAMCPAGYEHGDIASVINNALGNLVYRNKLGRVYDGQTGYRLNLENCYAPDVSFVSRERFKFITQAREKMFHGSPDLAVEILSPSDSITKTEVKVLNYLAHGTRLVWMVDPRNRSVRVYRPGGGFELISGNRVLTGNSVLPGFRVSLARIFEGV